MTRREEKATKGTHRGIATVVALVALTASGCAHRATESLRLETWPSPEIAADYPERDEANGLSALFDRPSFGVALSGGGTRAASAAWGQLRALEDLEWLDEARYLSAVSGGSWTAVPFSFLPLEAACAEADCDPDRRFLQFPKQPSSLTANDLRRFPEGSFGLPLSKTKLISLYLRRIVVRGDETYSRALGKRFLDRIGLYDHAGGKRDAPKHRYFVANAAQRDRILARGTDLEAGDFLLMTPGRPLPIAGSTMLARKRFARKPWQLFPVEITPLYAGVPQRMTTPGGGRVGGGFVESPGLDGRSYAYEGCPEAPCGGVVTVERPVPGRVGIVHRYRFTLSDVLGSSGAAPALFFRSLGWNLIGFPEFRYAPIGVPAAKAPELAFGDGGHLDNLGLLPLLARRTESILVFVNSKRPFGKGLEGGQVGKVFRSKWLAEPDGQLARWAGKNGLQPLLAPEGLERIERAFTALKAAGLPLTYCDTFDTLANERFGIPVYRPRICWSYLDRSQAWIDRLPDGHRLFRKLKRRRALPFTMFYRFPHYATFFHRALKLRVIDLGEEQVNAMAHLTAWSVETSAAAISGCFGLPGPAAPSEAARRVAAESGDCD